ncbi:type II toxin-antitoxin system RelB family antitoxin [Janthinobacterium violaceinigrum]|uniref:Stability determinant n=1 Tax=Janthinobacterium violaceinigrum TaxID=2654252 RepID=A0A6I1I0I5_9BURK|nr:stability determinant [Janthinobacterium violaceinigrum]KAB8063420.1 stability determinant [Janthinobacterium violaceinigrum]
MNGTPSSTTSEFETTEAAETYDRWFRAKVATSINDDRPARPHEAVMAQLRKIVAAQPDDHAADSMED